MARCVPLSLVLTSCHCKGKKIFQTTKTSEKFFLR
nr:MAG TPA: hypothetical protein [Caudoviricetes sp.]